MDPVVLCPGDKETIFRMGGSDSKVPGTVSIGKIYHTVNRLRSFLSLGHLVTWSLGHLVTRSLGHSVTRSLCHFQFFFSTLLRTD